MGFLGDIYNSTKNTFGNIYNRAKKTIAETYNNWSNGSYVFPGYYYLGPGNSLENGEPLNDSDAIARQHDLDYTLLSKNKHHFTDVDLKKQIRESDNRFLSSLNKHKSDGIGNRFGYYGIYGKTLLEDYGLMNPLKMLDTLDKPGHVTVRYKA